MLQTLQTVGIVSCLKLYLHVTVQQKAILIKMYGHATILRIFKCSKI